MVQELERKRQSASFPESAPAANPVFFRTYSRRTEAGLRESYDQVCDRTLKGLVELGKLTREEAALLDKMQRNMKALPSGRWMWVGGTDWLTKPKNFSGAYNCTSTNLVDWKAFGLMMDLAMMGCGTGAIIEPQYINQLPSIRNHLNITITGEIGSTPKEQRREFTQTDIEANTATIHVGDSREGWVKSYQTLLELSTDERFTGDVEVIVDISDVRQSGETLKGFGGMANPVKLPGLYQRCASILNKALGRQLNSVECCLLIDEAAVTIVAGNIRRSAGMRQFIAEDEKGATAKDNLWQQDAEGNWRIDPERDSLRMANHSRVFHHKPTLEESIAAVQKQYYSGEGAIQWAGEAVARANIDLLTTPELKTDFLQAYDQGKAKEWIQEHHPDIDAQELEHRLGRYGLNPCHAGDTLVSTNQGLVPIKDLVGKPFQALVDLRSVGLDGVKLTDAIAFPTGVQTTYLITLANGQQMRCTADHQHFTNHGWVATKDLTSEHHIYIQKGAGSFGEGTITVEQAQMLGWWYGDGYNVIIKPQKHGRKESHFAKGFVFNPQEYDYAYPVVGGAIKSITGVEYVRKLHKGVYEFRTQSPLLEEFFGNLEIENKDILPVKFLTQSQDVLIGFVQGIFSADGTVEKSCRRIKLVNKSKALLQQIQLILLQLGILSTVRCARKPGYRGVVYTTADGTQKISADNGSYALCIHSFGYKLFHQLIGFPLSPAKEQRLAEWDAKPLPSYTAKTINSCFTAQVNTVEEFGEEPVYDLHVPLTHSFIANGCITHNCGEIIGADFHCVSGDTLLITKDGMHKIQDIVDSEVEIWNGKNWSQVQPFKTGSSRVLYRVRFGDGSYLDATEYHRFFVKDRFGKNYKEVQTKDLMDTSHYAIHTEPFTIQYEDGLNVDLNYAYTLGVAVGDGTTDQKDHAKVRLYEKKAALNLSGNKSPIRDYDYLPTFTDVTDLGFSGEFLKSLKTNPETLNVIASWNRQAILHFIAGIADTDGSNTNSNGIRIYISDYDRAYRVQLLLTKCGIRSSVNLCAHQGAVTNYGIRSRDLYCLQITDCSEIPCQRLDVSKGTNAKYKGKWQVVKSVEQLPGLHDTYCFNESEYHKGVFGNTLTGNCNLSEVHLNQLDPDNYKEQEEAFTAGALSVAALLNHHFLEPRYQYSRELDPIVGVSFTGLFDFFVHAFGVDWLRWWEEGRPETPEGLVFKRGEQKYLSRWREIVHKAVWEYCDKHGIKRPNRCTTVQPSGCLDRTALRIFDQGLLYADELIAPGSGETINLNLSVRKGISVSTGIANQPLQLIKVTLSNGRILRMTPNHRLSINGNWVYAADMTSGMKIDFSLGEYQNHQEVSLLNIDQFEYTREGRQLELGHSRGVTATIIKTPKTMSPDLSYFIGALFGDGCLSPHKHRIRFCSNDYTLLERLQKIGQQLFALKGQIRKYSDREAFELSFASVQLFNWLQLNGLAKTEESQSLDRIPLAIRCSSKQSILSFFCGLIDTDGCIRSTGRMSIDSASEKFLRNLQQIGEAVGLCFSIFHNTQGENKQGQKDMWGLCLSRMLSQPDALAYLNSNSEKAQARPIPSPKRSFKFEPYTVASVEWEEAPDYSYDFAVGGIDDNDSWYWQGGIKSHNTKSLLTGASSGWHPPKAQRFIRRITFRKNDPVALACIDYGYNVIPSQSDKDENGNLLNDPFDPRCTEWLVEIPVAVSWADLPGADVIDVSKFSVLAQLDFVMQVQKYYTAHNTSATLELRSEEVVPLGTRIYEAIQNDEGYISAALLARFDDIQTFPRLPFEPIDKATYQRLSQEVKARRKTDDFCGALSRYDLGELTEAGPSGCDSDKCMFPEQAPTS